MNLPDHLPIDLIKRSLDKRFQKLWTLCVKSDHYDKAQWIDFESKINELYLAAKALELERVLRN